MSKRTVYTIITPLPPTLTRETVLAALHDHALMIELNPLVLSQKPVKPPRWAPADEYYSPWYEITDRVQYLPGGLMSGKISYHAVCHDLPTGLQTHCYAPMGIDIKGKWQLKGALPGEPPEVAELGVKTPRHGLYIREDIDMKCNFMMNSTVKKQLQQAHTTLLERILAGADLVDSASSRHSSIPSSTPGLSPHSPSTSYASSYQPYTAAVQQDAAPVELPGHEHDAPVELPAVESTAGSTSSSPPLYAAYNPHNAHTLPRQEVTSELDRANSSASSVYSAHTNATSNTSTSTHSRSTSQTFPERPSSFGEPRPYQQYQDSLSPPPPLYAQRSSHQSYTAPQPQQQYPHPQRPMSQGSAYVSNDGKPLPQPPHSPGSNTADTPALQRFRQNLNRNSSLSHG